MNNKLSISKIKEINNNYKNKKEELDKLILEIRKQNSLIDIDEYSKLIYEDMKELYKDIKYNINNSEIKEKLEKILNNKRLEEYPQLLDAHYYPELLKLEYLTKEQILRLDNNLKFFSNWSNIKTSQLFKGNEFFNTDDEVLNKSIKFLLNNNIIERVYVFKCKCGDDECFDKYISQEYKDKFYNIHESDWNKLNDIEKEEINKLIEEGYAWFEVGCWNGGDYEVETIEDFENNLNRIYYRVVKKPDLSLEYV